MLKIKSKWELGFYLFDHLYEFLFTTLGVLFYELVIEKLF